MTPEKEKQVIKDLLKSLDKEKDEGENVADFEIRLKLEVDNLLNL